jgi:hypothetical protein
MKPLFLSLSSIGFVLFVVSFMDISRETEARPDDPAVAPFVTRVSTPVVTPVIETDVKPIPEFVQKGLAWLAEAQFENGGWGAGAHASQGVNDPHAVQIDPATTAFSALALVRAGNTLKEGPYRENVKRALHYLIELVESHPKDSPNITSITGTQPQAKLGQNIDVSMAAQFFTRMLPLVEHDPALASRVQGVLEICLDKLALAQSNDGSWNDRGGWASVLQSAMANNAFELAEAAGLDFDKEVLEKSRAYQRSNVDAVSGEVRTESAAGVSLYSISSNQRATAKDALEAKQKIEQGKRDGNLSSDAQPTASNLERMGFGEDDARRLEEAYQQNETTREMLKSDAVLQGFGNNGGEEFLSFMMTSESLVVEGGEDWEVWVDSVFRVRPLKPRRLRQVLDRSLGQEISRHAAEAT